MCFPRHVPITYIHSNNEEKIAHWTNIHVFPPHYRRVKGRKDVTFLVTPQIPIQWYFLICSLFHNLYFVSLLLLLLFSFFTYFTLFSFFHFIMQVFYNIFFCFLFATAVPCRVAGTRRRRKKNLQLESTHHVSKLLNFLVTTLPKSIPKRSTILWARSGCDVPENTLMFGILECNEFNVLACFSKLSRIKLFARIGLADRTGITQSTSTCFYYKK